MAATQAVLFDLDDTLVDHQHASGMAVAGVRFAYAALRACDIDVFLAAAAANMVGDSWRNDVEGARHVGIRALWFNRHGTVVPAPAVPSITSLEPAGLLAERILAS